MDKYEGAEIHHRPEKKSFLTQGVNIKKNILNLNPNGTWPCFSPT